ncbi:MAG: FAD-linked oxidase [Nocardioidaceae bacterium]|nr:FAD-linked oxidase [Nocardioidaceae bacterium]
MAEPATATLDQLAAQFPDGVLETDPDIVASYAHDESRFTDRHLPWAVASPSSTDEVATCVRLAAEAGIPVVVRGAGSGLSGAANAPEGSLVISTRRLDNIISIHPVDRYAVVQPGVVTGDVRAAVAKEGMFYPPDPGSVAFSTIGGNVATNAGGMCCVKYGVTGDFVIGLEAVLADGRIMRTGRRTMKGVAGYDLTRLLVGSEGTLAVITEITLRLVPASAPASTMVATFAMLGDAGRAVQAIAAAGVDTSMLELMDATTLRAVEAKAHLGFDTNIAAALIVQSDAPTAADQLAAAENACRSVGATEVIVSGDPAEADMLLEARRLALPALEDLGDWLLDDVCVPRSRVVDLIEHIARVSTEESLEIGVFGHAGDGNMHPTVIFDNADPNSRAAAVRAFNKITARTLELGGTVTGEHGVGRLKAGWLLQELDPVSLDVQQQIRRTLDPGGLFNPGAVLT